ncbi:MAG: response regulator [Candidatus Thermoplasmatota archaeon]|nr:response regulator [Candidatus Thermoplasmatota archaeon]
MSDKQILLVEDNPDDAKLTKRAFNKIIEEHEYSFQIATDGKQAIQHLKNKPTPRFILLDLKLPRIDGFEVMKFIRSYEPTKLVPVIVLTSSTEENDRIRIYNLGANSYIQKPVDYKTFLDVVQIISSYWIKLNENPT